MSSRLPIEVNPFRLVEQRTSLKGTLPLKQLQRLQAILCSDGSYEEVSGTDGISGVTVELYFDKTETGLPSVSGKIETELILCCQRCLGALKHSVAEIINVVFVTSDLQAEELQQAYDTFLVEDDGLFLADFIEDEVLLILPLSIMHEACEPARPYIEALPENELNLVKKDNPFASLKNNLKDLE